MVSWFLNNAPKAQERKEKMKTIEILLFEFDELSESAKQKALGSLAEINVNHDWWDCLYDDAKTIGVKIKSFDIYRGDIKISLMTDADTVARKIMSDHGKNTPTYILAETFILTNRTEENQEDLEAEFESALGRKYLTLLQREFDYLTSEEAVVESIKAYDYQFTADGKMYLA